MASEIQPNTPELSTAERVYFVDVHPPRYIAVGDGEEAPDGYTLESADWMQRQVEILRAARLGTAPDTNQQQGEQ